jgi:hypothetical protein
MSVLQYWGVEAIFYVVDIILPTGLLTCFITEVQHAISYQKYTAYICHECPEREYRGTALLFL